MEETKITNIESSNETSIENSATDTSQNNSIGNENDSSKNENASNSNNEDNTDVNVKFDDDNENDSNEKSQKSVKQKSQHSNKDKFYAEKRRAQREGFLSAIDTNTYTGEKLESDEDIEVFKTMREMEKEGLDPTNTTDYLKYIKQKEEKAKKEQFEKEKFENEQKIKIQDKMNGDLNEFNKKYPNINFNEWMTELPQSMNNAAKENKDVYLKDKKAMISSFVGSGMTLIQAFEMYNRVTNIPVIENANQIAEQKIKNALATPGSQTDGNKNNDSPKDYLTMSDEEFRKEFEKRVRGY